ncbi:hypothetical protein SAOR_11950 [Salinisphaera orenii MK-B5]|uniref:DUF2795 domain-containing protein n=1 Tax=Salinisphaera orenii MK-B5 TaxID=856730 RepID=A0A423PJC0_9GAMM|nr:hypothetical protein SAOR_11950 [Salinisphaera orenii MK-B5]
MSPPHRTAAASVQIRVDRRHGCCCDRASFNHRTRPMAHDPTDIAGYLDGAKFPATGGELAGVAAGNGAPEDVLTRLRSFEGRHFEDANAVAQALTQGRD